MVTNDKRKRRSRGSAWYWKQTDCWYFTPPGTKRRVTLVDENGAKIRGQDNRQMAELAFARVKAAGQWRPAAEPSAEDQWLVAKVCSQFIAYCKRSHSAGSMSADYRDGVIRYLNDLCEYCGTLPVSQLTKGHIEHWVESHPTWRSPVTQRNAITIVIAAMNHGQDMHDVPHKLRGMKKPPHQPRLFSFSDEEEAAIYGATQEVFRDFLFAATHTGLRPFCELAKVTADDVVESDRGMMWKVFSSKTKKTRVIPVRSEVAKLAKRLMKTAPRKSGDPLFRNAQGNRWLKITGGVWFRRIRKELGWDDDPVRQNFTCYTCRHTFAHRMLSGHWNDDTGCSIEVLAELMGNTPKVAYDHYGREWSQNHQDPLWLAIGVGKPG